MTTSIWIIAITVRGRVGYTLWCNECGPNDTDLVLAHAGKILLFSDSEGILSYLRNGGEANIRRELVYENTTEKAGLSSDIDEVFYLGDSQIYDIDRTVELVASENWQYWTQSDRSVILDTLNMIWDMANSVHISEIITDMLNKEEDALGFFMDTLTLGDEISVEPRHRDRIGFSIRRTVISLMDRLLWL